MKVRVEGTDLYIDYDPLSTGTGYVPPRVKIEFGARSTGEPCEERQITCDAAEHLLELEFPSAKPRVMLPKRTFWEKATAVHVFCKQGTQGDRLSRHWHDLVRLDDAGYAEEAFNDRTLATYIAEFKGKFFREKDNDGNPIEYTVAVSALFTWFPMLKPSRRWKRTTRRWPTTAFFWMMPSRLPILSSAVLIWSGGRMPGTRKLALPPGFAEMIINTFLLTGAHRPGAHYTLEMSITCQVTAD